MQIKLPYGKGHIIANIDENRLNAIITNKIEIQPEKGAAEVERSMNESIGSRPLHELAEGKKNVVIIASDHTRPVPSKIIMPLMLSEIRRGNPDADITILIATGCHRGTTRSELVEKFGEDIVNSERIVIHDCQDDDMLVDIGTLPSGGRLIINKLAVQADLLVAEGFIEPHFFAGFSGGRKSVLPGIASRKTVHYNHCAEFIASEKARCGILEGNPIHNDMLYAAKKAGLAYIVNVVINSKKEIIASFAGDVEQAHLAGCGYLEDLAKSEPSYADIVISTNNGYPLDQNIYQAVKGMTAAEATANAGAVIIMVAKCEDGHGGEGFLNTFDNCLSVDEIYDAISEVKAEDTAVDQWQSQVFARVLKKHKVILVSDCDEDTVKKLRMIPACDIEHALEIATSIKGSDAKITVIPEGISSIIV